MIFFENILIILLSYLCSKIKFSDSFNKNKLVEQLLKLDDNIRKKVALELEN